MKIQNRFNSEADTLRRLSQSFIFSGSQICVGASSEHPIQNLEMTDFSYDNNHLIHSFQVVGNNMPPLLNRAPYVYDSDVPTPNNPIAPIPYDSAAPTEIAIDQPKYQYQFSYPDSSVVLGTLNTDKIKNLFGYYLALCQNDMDYAFGGYVVPDATPDKGKKSYHELKQPYSLYNWEVCFHALMLLVDRLLTSQQFDQALAICDYVFNPIAKPGDGEEITRACWRFPPFKTIEATRVLEKIFNGLQPGQSDTDITKWRENPFQPHLVARDRPSAYMKYVVMKYIEILIAYGDYYFRQNTMESFPLAIQCYVMASHLYGPRGQKIPKRGRIQNQTYKSLLDKWDAFGDAMVKLEVAFPSSNQSSVNGSGADAALANIFGSMTTHYFGIPNNPNLTALRDTIDDRLLKIRSTENIEGIFQQLPLFEPPIDPALLVQAAAQGLSLSSVLNDMNSPMPNYRFYYLLQKALELCGELKSLGNAFLAAKEKGDAEALSTMRATHDRNIQNLVMEVRKQQLDETTKSLEALQQNRIGIVSRMKYFLQLIGEDVSKVPDENTDFSELPNQLEQPVDESGLKLIKYEKEEMDKSAEAADWQIGIGAVETLASVLHAIPTTTISGHPWGVGTDISWGPPNLANVAQAVARGLQVHASNLSWQSSFASRKAGFLRQLQDRVQQANAAGYEIKNIDKQILTQRIRIDLANLEISNQQQQIDNATEVEDYLRNKYTNPELYSWMEGNIRTLYYQAYSLAYDLAKKAEKVYRFERGLTSSNYIQFGYWDAGRDGLLAGEKLYLALKQLETAYQEKRGYDYEITKHVSLRQLDPLALIELREKGSCQFSLPELLFDMDHPGHYMRRIKSVALSVPCVVGPYTSLNCTLRLQEHEFRINSMCHNGYRKGANDPEDRFGTVNVPISSIAVSNGQNDSGVFELNFRDERYIPFEGAGVISKWSLELPKEFRQFDYNTISDVIMHLRYTSVDGGNKLKVEAARTLTEFIKSNEDLSQHEGLFAAFDLKHDFPTEWHKANNPLANRTEGVLTANQTAGTLTLNNLSDRLPLFTKMITPPKTVKATHIYLLTSDELAKTTHIDLDGEEFGSSSQVVGTMQSFSIKEKEIPVDKTWQITIDPMTEIKRLWLVVRYVLE